MRKVIFIIGLLSVLLLGCQGPSDTTSPHGEDVAETPQLPFQEGSYEVTTTNTDYGPATGYQASPSPEGDYPGVVLIHEWWGLNDNIKATAEKLASHGYDVLAVDLYNGSVANTSGRAQQLSSQVSEDQAMVNLQAAQSYLEGQGAESVASFGFCFGGDQSMRYAVQAQGPDASVVYYGSPVLNDSALERLDRPFFGAYGAEDRVVDVDNVRAFEAKLSNRSNVSINYYDGVGHAFANPSGDSFNEDAASDAWNKTLSFLNESLR